MFKQLSELIELAKSKPLRKLAVAAADDEPVLQAVMQAREEKSIELLLVGNEGRFRAMAADLGLNLDGVSIIAENNPAKAASIACAKVSSGDARILMKGMVGTGSLLKAVLDKETGLRKGALLSHLAIYESPYYHKLLGVTDAAMNIQPSLEEKVHILNNAVEAFHKLGMAIPKVALITAVETVNAKMPATLEAAMLTMMNKRKQITGCLVDGPLAIDNAVSKEAAEHKGIVSEVAGDADILMTPDINAGNVLYKCLGFLGARYRLLLLWVLLLQSC